MDLRLRLKQLAARVMVRITGFKPKRVAEWVQVLKAEGRAVGRWRLARLIAVEALSRARQGKVAGGATWRVGMRQCARCPIYNPRTKACRDMMGAGSGCGCYMPIKRLAGGQTCWLAATHLHM